MAERDKEKPVMLFSDLPADELRVRAVLEDWGFGAESINHLLAEGRPRRTMAQNSSARKPTSVQPGAPSDAPAPRVVTDFTAGRAAGT